MAQTCNGLCERLKTAPTKNSLRYKMGQKRCSLCAHFFHIEGNRCPCCKTILRSKPRNQNRKFKNLELRKNISENEILVSEHVTVKTHF